MRLTNYSDYALRALIYLAVEPSPYQLANIQDIADSYGISKSHLTKIIHQLSRLGYIDSVRGKHGGIRLAKAPKDIHLGMLIRHTEPDFAVVDCFSGLQSLSEVNKCLSAANTRTADRLAVQQLTDDAITATDKPVTAPNTPSCVIDPVCQLKPIVAEATQAFLAVLDRYTLADVICNTDELRQRWQQHIWRQHKHK